MFFNEAEASNIESANAFLSGIRSKENMRKGSALCTKYYNKLSARAKIPAKVDKFIEENNMQPWRIYEQFGKSFPPDSDVCFLMLCICCTCLHSYRKIA